MATRYFIFLSFRGTSYCGWQVQPASVTVQAVIEEALSTILREKISTTGAGRTDSGVHAKLFCAHFDSSHSDLETSKNLLTRLNRFLPADIAVHSIKKVKNEAHARYSAISRTYRYYVTKNKDPFREDTSWYVSCHLDVEIMNKACQMLISTSDFTSFSKLHSNAKTNVCNVHYARWEDKGNLLVFTIKANRFLRNMVRAIVGTMVELGRGRLALDDFEKIIVARNRCKAGKSVPAKGLFLEDIEYPGDIFL